MSRRHRYEIELDWTGNLGPGTTNYRAYSRNHELGCQTKPVIAASSDPSFRGERDRCSPEELLVASLSSCHQLWYLHLCADAGVVVTGYADRAVGCMTEEPTGERQFIEVVLRPRVTIAQGSDAALALKLHAAASAKCFIARSMNLLVKHEPTIEVADDPVRT